MSLKNEAENAAAMLRCLLDQQPVSVEDMRDMVARLEAVTGTNDGMEVQPTPAIIICPVCHTQHIDKDEWATTRIHKNHLCAVCGLVWRPPGPAPSVGVAEVPKS